MGLTNRQARLAKQLGLALPEEIIAFYQGNAEAAAEEVRLALERQLENVIATSESGALDGYMAIKEPPEDLQKIVLPKSGVDLSGRYRWVVTVLANPTHQSIGLNVFNILDSGREPLPRRDPKTRTPYPLWGLSPQNRAQNPAKGGRIFRPTQAIATRRNERGGASRLDDQEFLGPFTFGPIRAVAAQDLYKRALAAAKDRLSGSGFSEWNVILVGATDG